MLRSFACFLFALSACGGEKQEDPATAELSAGTMNGKINGKSWTFAVGDTNAAFSTGDTYWAQAFSQAVACGAPSSGDYGASAILDLPKQTGEYEFGPGLSATFVAPGVANVEAVSGHLTVEKVSDSAISGGAVIYANDDNFLNGHFTFRVCK